MEQAHATIPEPDVARFEEEHFGYTNGRPLGKDELQAMKVETRRASRWQHIFSGAQHSHLLKMRSDSITEKPGNRITAAFAKFRTRLTRSTYCKKPGLGAATPWFDIVDPEYRWYEEDTRVRRP